MKALLALLAITLGGCWVDRRTSDFACGSDVDCVGFMPQRVCDTDIGYCVPGANPNDCPLECNAGCDKAAMTCIVACGSGDCDDLTCPAGYDCTITCSGGNSCNNIDCDGRNCTIVCSGSSACNNIDCNDGKCSVECSGGNACDNVDCSSSCGCNVVCTNPSSCDSVSCPADACISSLGCTATQTGCPTTCN